MGHVAGVPTFRQHGHRYDAPHLVSGLPWFADRIDDLPQLFCCFIACRVRVFAFDLLQAFAVNADRPEPSRVILEKLRERGVTRPERDPPLGALPATRKRSPPPMASSPRWTPARAPRRRRATRG
ncbi:MAG: hypothetical protein GW893_14065 [Armatimonadetes bacterium]|nr:hypothetical protein [Armatimonadota bacterium]